jgi:hypothetical protein
MVLGLLPKHLNTVGSIFPKSFSITKKVEKKLLDTFSSGVVRGDRELKLS